MIKQSDDGRSDANETNENAARGGSIRYSAGRVSTLDDRVSALHLITFAVPASSAASPPASTSHGSLNPSVN